MFEPLAKKSIDPREKANVKVGVGLNYERSMEVSFKAKKGKKAVAQFVQVVVYRNLKNVCSLTSRVILKETCRNGN